MANGVDGLPAAMAAAFSSFTNYFTLQTAYASIPIYDGQKPELRDFIRSIETAYSIVPGIDQKTFVAGLITKISGSARDTIEAGQTFNTIDALAEHLRTHTFNESHSIQFYLCEMQLAKI